MENEFLQNQSTLRTRNNSIKFIKDSLAKDVDAPIHASDQPNYSDWYEQPDQDSPTAKFFYYRYGGQEIDNDVSALPTAVRGLLHPFLDPDSFSRQYYDEGTYGDVITIYRKKFQLFAIEDVDAVFRGDTCTSAHTPLKLYLNHYMEENPSDDKTRSLRRCLDIPEGGRMPSSGKLEEVWKRSREELCDIIDDMLADEVAQFLKLSDTLGNMMICPAGCNTSRSNWGMSDTIDYYMAHIYMYYANACDVRYLSRLFAQYYVGGQARYRIYEHIDDVQTDAELFAVKNFLHMLELMGANSWEKFVDKMYLRAACDDELIPLSLITGETITWDGIGHLSVAPANMEEDVARCVNLCKLLRQRNIHINDALSRALRTNASHRSA